MRIARRIVVLSILSVLFLVPAMPPAVGANRLCLQACNDQFASCMESVQLHCANLQAIDSPEFTACRAELIPFCRSLDYFCRYERCIREYPDV